MTLDQILGWGWVEAIHPEERGYVVREILRRHSRSGSSYGVEYRFPARRTGFYRWYLSRAEPLRDEDGQIARWFGISVRCGRAKASGGSLTGKPVVKLGARHRAIANRS